MEPTIYKPSIYKGAGIYEGAGGIYKGRGVYNMGENGKSFIIIDGIEYPVVKIGDQLWMAENLRNEFSGILINPNGTSNSPALHYSNEAYKKSYGCLYNYYAADYIETNKNIFCPPGWHVPNNTDFNNLFANIGGINNAPLVLRDSNWGGTDEYDLSLVPSGYYNGSYVLVGSASYLWSIDKNGILAYHLDLKSNSCDFLYTYGYMHWEFNLRLCLNL